MNFNKKCFSVATLAILFAAFFSAAPVAQAQQTREHILLIRIQTEPQAASYIRFQGIDGDCQVQEGKNTIGENTKNGDKIIATIRGGVLHQVGVRTATGKYKAWKPTAAPCFPNLSCSTQNLPKCFRYNGQCICICGPWIANPTGN